MNIVAFITITALIYLIHEIHISVCKEMAREKSEKRAIEEQNVLEDFDEEQKEEREAIRKELSELLIKREEYAERVDDYVNGSHSNRLSDSERKDYHRIMEDMEKLESRITEMDQERRYVELYGHREQ